ncbi:E3 SUMO-protein ligase nse2 [Termitomyces sp. T112]|nr:E3 SUMO-protein ligase nse2 [Termitomyces sp. T112]
MPSATFSRKKSHKRQASSEIEDGGPSSFRGVEQVEDDEDEPYTRRVNRVKTEKKPNVATKKERVLNDEDEDNGGDDDDDERIDVENFHDQPLSRVEFTRLQGLSRDWKMVADQVKPNWSVVGDVAVALADHSEGKEVEQGLAELDKLMRGLIDISAEMQAHEKVLEDLAQQIGQGEVLEDFIHHYMSGVKERKKKYDKMTSRQKYAKSQEYARFRNNIYEVQHPDTAIPPITEFLPKEDGDDSDEDDDLEMGGISQNYNCPITLTLLVDPVTSDVCQHSFSKAAIFQSFRGTEAIKCPASGCTKRFTRANLKPDKDLAKRVKAYERRARRAVENDDAEEIID